MHPLRLPVILLIGLLLAGLLPTRGHAQNGTDGLSIGLVLSGGGAKGYAHIGALQVIEEAGIEVDYIGGTSMGAIVGGLYAAGYSADQLEQMLRKTDIMSVIQDAVEREDRTIYEKLNEERYLFGVSMKDFSVQLPTALSDGQRVHDLFAHWTARVGHVRDFSELPIPYLAVATDLETGDPIVLEGGMLAEAMRASAALPGVLSPYPLDGKLLTDGGVSNNYPAEEIKAKGVDFVLGISVESDPYKADQINSIDKLLMQIAFFQANRRNIEQYEMTDLDIKPDLSGFSVLSFDDIDTLISAGRQAALAQLPELRALAERQGKTTSRRDSSLVSLPRFLNVRNVEVTGNRDLSDRQVLSFFEGQLPGRISWVAFREGLAELHVSGRYKAISYRYERTGGPEEEVDLDIIMDPQTAFGQRVRLGLHYDQVYRSNLLLNMTLYDLIVDNSLASLDLIVGNRFRYNFELRFNRINGMAVGLRSRYNFADVPFDLPRDITTVRGLTFTQLDFRFTDLNAELFWDIRQTDNSFTGIAAELKYYRTKSDQISQVDTVGFYDLSDDFYFVPKIYLRYDKLSDVNFPLRGFSIDSEARLIRNLEGGVEDFGDWATNIDINFLGMIPFGEQNSLGLGLSAGAFLQEASLPYLYYLGSNNLNLMNNFKPFPSLELGQASGQALLMGDVFWRMRLGLAHHFHLGLQAAYLDRPPRSVPSSVREDRLWAARVGYGLATPLGPIELTYARGNAGGELYFNLGYWF